MKKVPNVETEFLENFWENWVFMNMDGYYGQIIIFHRDWVPENWMVCDGSELNVSDYTPLSVILGVDYNEEKTFNLPKLDFPHPDFVYIICVNGVFPVRS